MSSLAMQSPVLQPLDLTDLPFTALVKSDRFQTMGPGLDRLLIQAHFFQVEALLRSRDVSDLSEELRERRSRALDALHAYWTRGLFPKNVVSEEATPVFIDHHDTFCGVGHLMRSDGHEGLARRIAETDLTVRAESFLAPDFADEEIFSWIAQSGLTPEEVALVQPGYPRDCSISTVPVELTDRILMALALLLVFTAIGAMVWTTVRTVTRRGVKGEEDYVSIGKTAFLVGAQWLLLSLPLVVSINYLISTPKGTDGGGALYGGSAVTSNPDNMTIRMLFSNEIEVQTCTPSESFYSLN